MVLRLWRPPLRPAAPSSGAIRHLLPGRSSRRCVHREFADLGIVTRERVDAHRLAHLQIPATRLADVTARSALRWGVTSELGAGGDYPGAVPDATSSIRVGSGGVLLPYYSPLKVAEASRMLHALRPGRIDLGVGRAAGPSRPP